MAVQNDMVQVLDGCIKLQGSVLCGDRKCHGSGALWLQKMTQFRCFVATENVNVQVLDGCKKNDTVQVLCGDRKCHGSGA